jgi:hypothetical protein
MKHKKTTNPDPFFKAFNEAFPAPSMPQGHQQRFDAKLKNNTQVQRPFQWLRIAVVALFCIGLGSVGTLYFSSQTIAPDSFYQTETYFTSAITTTLKQVEASKNNTNAALVEDAKKQLTRLQNDYIKLQGLMVEAAAHPKVLNAMIHNLERQLDLVQELKQLITQFKKTNDATEIL